MDTNTHTLNKLFEQLGLPSSDQEIEQFVKTHRLFGEDIPLHEASFWTESQASFLRDEILCDAAWAEAVDELNLLLHPQH